MKTVSAKFRGYYNYYGMIGNSQSLSDFYYYALGTLYKWLNRRSQRHSVTWPAFKAMIKRYNVPQPRITQQRTTQLSLRFT